LQSHCDITLKLRVTTLEDVRNRVLLRIREVLKQDLLAGDVSTVLCVVKDNDDLPVIPSDDQVMRMARKIVRNRERLN
jgi:hypothetical protein